MPTFDDVRRLARDLPGVEESTSYGTPAFKLKGRLLARLRPGGNVLVVRVDMLQREALLHANPAVYFVTPHYADYPAVLVRLAAVHPDELRALLQDARHFASTPQRQSRRRGGRGGR